MKEKLKQIRMKLNKTQKEMSALLGLGEITWQNYERGISKPKIETLEKLAKLGFNINWVTSSDNKDMLSTNVEEGKINLLTDDKVLNKTLVFNMVLNEMKNLYKNYNPSKLSHNYIENKTFEMTMNIISVAGNNEEAIKMIKLLLNQEKQSLRKN